MPQPVDVAGVQLPQFALDIQEKFAENLHELWAMRKIDLGWSCGQTRSEKSRRHPCLTSYEALPPAEQTYNLNLALDTLKYVHHLCLYS